MRLLTSIVHLRPQIIDTSIHTSYLIRIFKERMRRELAQPRPTIIQEHPGPSTPDSNFRSWAVAVVLRLPCQEARIIRSGRGSSTGIFTALENTLLQHRQGLLQPHFFLCQALVCCIRPDNRDTRELALADLKHMGLADCNSKFPIRDALAIHAHSTGLDHTQ
jgi:hypothetical protein